MMIGKYTKACDVFKPTYIIQAFSMRLCSKERPNAGAYPLRGRLGRSVKARSGDNGYREALKIIQYYKHPKKYGYR